MCLCPLSHASISAAVRAERGLPENLIRLCVGIEDPRDLIDDLEHSLLSSGAIAPNYSHSTSSSARSEELYGSDREAWIVERAKGYRRPQDTAMDRLVKGVKLGLGLGVVDRNTLDADIVVSAPGKVILFGEHAVVHGVVSTPEVYRSSAERYDSDGNRDQSQPTVLRRTFPSV